MNQKNSLGLNNCFLDLDDPIELFKKWMSEAEKTEINDPNALSIATINKNNEHQNNSKHKTKHIWIIPEKM